MDDWVKERIAELEARAPVKRPKTKPYVKVDLSLAATGFAAMKCQKGMVLLWLVHQARKTGTRTFTVPSGALAKLGVDRKAKSTALRQLERAGLIEIERRLYKNPIVTLLELGG